MSTIGEAALRCKEITQRLLNASADPGEVSFDETDLVEVVREILTLIEHEAERRNVQLSSELVKKGLLQGDRKRLGQLTMNLIMNSLEAVEDGGKIGVSVKPANGFLRLEVADDGCGISESELQLVFDPFYTTKRRGRGTGLGLSICESIVRQHQGQIHMESKPGQGTRVTVVLPSLGVVTG